MSTTLQDKVCIITGSARGDATSPRARRRQRTGHPAPADHPASRTRADEAAAAGPAPGRTAAGRAGRSRRTADAYADAGP